VKVVTNAERGRRIRILQGKPLENGHDPHPLRADAAPRLVDVRARHHANAPSSAPTSPPRMSTIRRRMRNDRSSSIVRSASAAMRATLTDCELCGLRVWMVLAQPRPRADDVERRTAGAD